MIPARVGRSPLKNPLTPWASKIRLPMAIAFPLAAASSPVEAEEDWSWVRITSRGFVMQDATVPAIPPDSRLLSLLLLLCLLVDIVCHLSNWENCNN